MLEVQDLERHVNAAVLQLIVSSFTETLQPGDRLVRAALKPNPVSTQSNKQERLPLDITPQI